MKKILTVFTIAVYCFLVFVLMFVFGNKNEVTRSMQLFTIAGILLFFVILLLAGILNIINAVKEYTDKNEIDIKMVKYFKYIHIPFFIINFIVWILLFIAIMFNPLIILFPLFAFIGILVAFFVMLSTSVYVILYVCGRIHTKTIKYWAFHIILQMIFIADIVDCIYLQKTHEKI